MNYRAFFALPLAVLFTGCAASIKKPAPIKEPALCQGSFSQRNLTVIWSKRHYWCGNQALPVVTEPPKNKPKNSVIDSPGSVRESTRIKPSRLKSSHKRRTARRKSVRKKVQRPVDRTEGAPLASASNASSVLLNTPPIAPDARVKMAPRQGASLIQDKTPPVSGKAAIFKSGDNKNPIFVAAIDDTPPSVITFASGALTLGPSGREKLASLILSLDVNKPVWVVGHTGGQEDLEDQDAGVVATQRAESVRKHLLELGLKSPVEIKNPSQIQAGRYVKVGQE
ncbi:MAG: hypothetical protein DSZ28_06740 [Thiothrix sp.]|nr:MAG: hypothetical protein DSZ28_06740 [Thiothrix sp.]